MAGLWYLLMGEIIEELGQVDRHHRMRGMAPLFISTSPSQMLVLAQKCLHRDPTCSHRDPTCSHGELPCARLPLLQRRRQDNARPARPQSLPLLFHMLQETSGKILRSCGAGVRHLTRTGEDASQIANILAGSRYCESLTRGSITCGPCRVARRQSSTTTE